MGHSGHSMSQSSYSSSVKTLRVHGCTTTLSPEVPAKNNPFVQYPILSPYNTKKHIYIYYSDPQVDIVIICNCYIFLHTIYQCNNLWYLIVFYIIGYMFAHVYTYYTNIYESHDWCQKPNIHVEYSCLECHTILVRDGFSELICLFFFTGFFTGLSMVSDVGFKRKNSANIWKCHGHIQHLRTSGPHLGIYILISEFCAAFCRSF